MDFAAIAREVFAIEAAAVAGLSDGLDGSFSRAVLAILATRGRVIVCGIGKSGIIGKKIAATLASTGTPAFFMHPGEAFHGDLGMVTADDVFLAISNSGETEELIKLLPFLRDNGNLTVTLTGNAASTLAQHASLHLSVRVPREACPLQLAPTASTTATLAMGDALAVALMRARDFQPHHFARLHPGGSLGRRLLQQVRDEMRTADLPFVGADADADTVLQAMTRGRLGIALVTDRMAADQIIADQMTADRTASDQKTADREATDASVTVAPTLADDPDQPTAATASRRALGIITDGDLRRAMQIHGAAFFERTAADLMTPAPVSIAVDASMHAALELMAEHHITLLVVVDGERVVGVVQK